MSIQFPRNRREVSDRIKSDVQTRLVTSNPFLANSFLDSLIKGFAGRTFDLFENLKILVREIFPDTATGEFLERWGELKNVTRNSATKATGFINATGVAGSTIPAATLFQSSDSNQYVSQDSATINDATISVSTATQVASLVTIVTVTDHNFATGISVTISGAVEAEYNGTFTITVTALDTFTYQIVGSPSTPATGTILANVTIANVEVRSDDFGIDQNLLSGANLTLGTPIVGVDGIALVQFSEVSGGTDTEDDVNLRERTLDVYQQPPTPFNVDRIRQKAREVPGVTRVFITEANDPIATGITPSSITQADFLAIVDFGATKHNLEDTFAVTVAGAVEPEFNVTQQRIIKIDDFKFAYPVLDDSNATATGTILVTLTVPPGAVLIHFTRDDDENIIPSAQEATDVKDKLLEITPAHTDVRDVIVRPPEAVVVDFIFTLLVPDSNTLREAITANLLALFADETAVGRDLKDFEYESVIFQTVNPETFEAVSNFTLSTPSGDVTILEGQLPVLGTISF